MNARHLGPATLGLSLLISLSARPAHPDEAPPPNPRPTREYLYAGSRLLAIAGPLPRVALPASPVEAREGGGPARVVARLDTPDGGPLAGEVRLGYATVAGSANVREDYLSVAGELVFPAGSPDGAEAGIAVTLLDDRRHESVEELTVNITAPPGLVTDAASLTVRIADDDPPPVLRALPTSVPEGDSGSVPAVLTLALSERSGLPAVVAWRTEDSTATAGSSDYLSASGVATVPAGQTSQTIAVPVVGDRRVEPDETFLVRLSSPEHVSLDGDVVGVTIVADDVPRLAVSFGTSDGSRSLPPPTEGGTATFHVTLDGWLGPVSVKYATADETARAGRDYVATSGTLVFDTALVLQRSVRVPLLDDALPEAPETFRLVLSEPVGAALGTPFATAVIRDDDTGVVP
jgi:hypothetical protein